MATKILNDIHNDLKLLITAITNFEENEEGFRICERFALSNFKHHRYLSVNSHATKETVAEITKKFSIHGKYEVAKKFEDLVQSFLTSFDFENHPQYDLQWSLLTLLLDLSSETSKSSLESLTASQGEHNITLAVGKEEDSIEEIDWAEYLKEGQDKFFCNFKSDSESDWSDDIEDEFKELTVCTQISSKDTTDTTQTISIKPIQCDVNIFSETLVRGIESRNWLSSNVQNTWWNDIESYKFPISSKFPDADFCNTWHKITSQDTDKIGTLSEYQTCRELLWMFLVPQNMVVFQKQADTEFTVAPNISIPSLSPVAFVNFLTSYCEYYSMIQELQKFDRDLYDENIDLKPPLTYEAYNAALKQHLHELQEYVIEIEKNFMKQEDCNTFLTLSESLTERLYLLKTLSEVHTSVTTDWRTHDNWLCAATLLSRLYFEMENSSSRKKTNICAHLYLSSITVYLNIIDTWLSEGRLEDWRDEFVIFRVPTIAKSEVNQHDTFKVRNLSDVCLRDPIMHLLLCKLQHLGHNIELLDSLDRISDIWKINTENKATRMSLNDEFSRRLQSEINKYSFSESMGKVDIITEYADTPLTETEVNTVCTKMDVMNLEENIIQQLSAIDNPFLMKVFQDYVPSQMFKSTEEKEISKNQSKENIESTLLKRLQNIPEYILPWRKILECSLSKTLNARYDSASKLVKNIMKKEYKLEVHLKLLRSIYMMEAGHIMHKFNQSLFHEIESNKQWNNSYFLSCILEEALSQEWPESSSRWSIKVTDNQTNEVIQAVKDITLHYAIDWPISLVINKEALEKYNDIFRFQLKLKWALWTLNNLKFSDLEGSKCLYTTEKIESFFIRRLENLRFWLLHAIGSIHAYLSGQVLQNLGFILEKALTEAESLDTIISVHNEYLMKAHEHCLLTTEYEDLMVTINNLIEMCIHVRQRWTRDKLLFAMTELDVMERSYMKYHTYLALALHSAVQHKDADYYKLTPKYQCMEYEYWCDESTSSTDFMTHLSRDLLTEIAYQSLPPSGIPIPIPRMIDTRDWQALSPESTLPNELLLNAYERMFSYMRWYRYEENSFSFYSSTHALFREMKKFIDKQYD